MKDDLNSRYLLYLCIYLVIFKSEQHGGSVTLTIELPMTCMDDDVDDEGDQHITQVFLIKKEVVVACEQEREDELVE